MPRAKKKTKRSPHTRSSWEEGVEGDDTNMNSIPEDLEVRSASSDVGHSLPNPDEMERPRTSKKFLLKWLIAGSVLIAAGAVLALFLLEGGTDDGRVIRNAGTARDTASDRKRRIRLQRYLIKNGINADEDFADPESPQSQALDFLAFVDEKRLQPPSGDLRSRDGYQLLTRYVMSLFYYQMDGPNWNFDLLFLSEFDTCFWFSLFEPPIGQIGVICNENTNEITGLSFIGDNVSGELPKELAHLTTLSYLESINNEVSGSIPAEFESLTNLRTMVFVSNSMSGPIPSWISSLGRLEFLFLSDNMFTGNVPIEIQDLENLKVLGLNDNQFNGGIDSIWKLPRLEYLFIEGNQFTGTLPNSLSAATPGLINMDVSSNGLSGTLPSDIFELSNLEILDLHGNEFEGPIPNATATSDGSRMKFLALHENALGGQIPLSLSGLNALTHLDLSSNRLVGQLPDLRAMIDLNYLFLADNDFEEGVIPDYIFAFQQLKELSLKRTRRVGGISRLFGLLDKLVVLDLDDNRLTGSIPSQVGGMTDLQFALLNRNFLTSTLPAEFAQLSDLRMALLNGNNITGDFLPICKLPSLSVAVNDCAETTCECCNVCCSDGEDCHDFNEIASQDPSWMTSYRRTFFDFSASRRFGARDVNKENPN